jgi:hypothetical protein
MGATAGGGGRVRVFLDFGAEAAKVVWMGGKSFGLRRPTSDELTLSSYAMSLGNSDGTMPDTSPMERVMRAERHACVQTSLRRCRVLNVGDAAVHQSPRGTPRRGRSGTGCGYLPRSEAQDENPDGTDSD